MRVVACLSALALSVTTVVAVGSPAAAAPPKPRYITEGFAFHTRDESLKHLPELRRKVIEDADKPEQPAKRPADTPADAIRRAQQATEDYSVLGTSLTTAVAPLGNEDWITLDECRHVHADGFSDHYFHKNKFSSCYSEYWTFPILDRVTRRPIADVRFLLTFVIRGYNGQRYFDVQVQMTDWSATPYDAAWTTIAPGLAYRLSPNCTYLDSGSSCGAPTPAYVQVPYGSTLAESLFYLPTTTTPWSGDTNPLDNKGYYIFVPDLLGTHVGGLTSDSHNALAQEDLRCDNASYGSSLGSGGCLFTKTRSHLTLSCNPAFGMTESTCFIKDAFEDITRTYPGILGTYVPGDDFGANGPLTRNYWQNNGVNNTSRTAARALCTQGYGSNYTTLRTDGQTNDCDEYPFLSTYQNANSLLSGSARGIAVRPVLSQHNQEAGRKLNTYYAADRILDGDAFYIQIVDRGYCDGLQIPLPLPGGGYGSGTGGTGGGTGGGNTIPVITVESVTIEGNTTGGYSGPIPGVTATDADGDPVTLTNNAPAVLPLGVTTVAWVARDPAGNRTVATQTVTVVDSRGPSISCPPATYRTLHPTLDLPAVHDAVDPNPIVTNDAPALFRLGVTTVTWTATDHSGNSTRCAQTVKIIYAPPLAGGQAHSLAVNVDGTASAWGNNTYGQLGNGTTTSSTTAVPVSGLTGILAVTSGNLSSYAVTNSGTVYAWGDNTYGQLGNGTRTRSTSRVQVSGLSGVTQVAAGNAHVLALKSDGTVVGWGLNNAGQLGTTSASFFTTPVAVPGLTNVVQVAAGGLPGWAGHSAALKNDGTVWTWGYGKHGQLGLGVNGSITTPTKVAGLSDIVLVAANGDNTYALKSDGTVYAWGDGAYGQIGNVNAAQNQNTPLQSNISGVVAINAGGTFAIAIKADGTVWDWGDNNTGQLGDGAICGKYCTTPVQARSLTSGGWIAGGYVHSLAETTSGSVYGWGSNAWGQLGNGTTTVANTPTQVPGVTAVH